jgi:hypothetical protein
MAVKMLQREVTTTKVVFAQLETYEGKAIVVEKESELIGNVSEEKAVKILSREFGSGVTILRLEANTQKYEMPVEEFIQLATKVKEKVE